MSIAQLSPTSVAANPAYVNPQVRAENNTTPNQSSQSAQLSVQSMKTDTVTLSTQALQMSAKSNESQAEPKEDSAKRTYESLGGRR